MLALIARRVARLEQLQESRTGTAVVLLQPGEQLEQAAQRLGLASMAGRLALPEAMHLDEWATAARHQQAQLMQAQNSEGKSQ